MCTVDVVNKRIKIMGQHDQQHTSTVQIAININRMSRRSILKMDSFILQILILVIDQTLLFCLINYFQFYILFVLIIFSFKFYFLRIKFYNSDQYNILNHCRVYHVKIYYHFCVNLNGLKSYFALFACPIYIFL